MLLSIIKLIFVILFVCSSLVLRGSTNTETNNYFNVPPVVSNITPDSFDVEWDLYTEFDCSTHYHVQLNRILYGSSTQNTHMHVEGLAPGGQYNVSVITVHNGYAQGVSSATPILMPPNIPQYINVYEVGTASFKIFWQQVRNATSYRIYEYPTFILKQVQAPAVRAEVTGLEPGSFISVMMTAMNETGESWHSDPIPVQLLPTPPPFTVVQQETGSTWFNITWEEMPGVQRYMVYINDEKVASMPYDATEYLAEGLPAGTSVKVQLQAENSSGKSELSEPLIVQLVPPAPNLIVNNISSWSAEISWSVSNGATYYKVYEDEFWPIFNVPDTINTITITENIYEGQTATYTVKAGNETGESEHSNPVIVTYTSRTSTRNQDIYQSIKTQPSYPKFYCNRIKIIISDKADQQIKIDELDYIAHLASVMNKVSFIVVVSEHLILAPHKALDNLKIYSNSNLTNLESKTSQIVISNNNDGVMYDLRMSALILTPELIKKKLFAEKAKHIYGTTHEKLFFDKLHSSPIEAY